MIHFILLLFTFCPPTGKTLAGKVSTPLRGHRPGLAAVETAVVHERRSFASRSSCIAINAGAFSIPNTGKHVRNQSFHHRPRGNQFHTHFGNVFDRDLAFEVDKAWSLLAE